MMFDTNLSLTSGYDDEDTFVIPVLVLAPLTVVMPRAYATGPYDKGYKTAKFDLHHKSYSDSCHTDCTLYKLGYSEAWDTLNGWLGNR